MLEVEGLLEGMNLGLRGESVWKVYIAKFDMVEFWQGSRNRVRSSVHFITAKDCDTWVKEILWPSLRAALGCVPSKLKATDSVFTCK